MATLPPKACNKPLCPNHQTPTGRGYCATHTVDRPKPKPSEIKQERDRFYDSVKWKNYRYRYLMLHPMCELCMSNQTATEARHLDHIIPRSAGGPDYPEYNGVRGLCHSCHSVVTAQYTRNPQRFIDEVCKHYSLDKPIPRQ